MVTMKLDVPNGDYTDEKIIADVEKELLHEGRNDTLATDRIARLANRIEYYGLLGGQFADHHPYWRSCVAYLRHGDFPNPGIDRNGPEFTYVLKNGLEMLREVVGGEQPRKAVGDGQLVEETDYSTIEEQKQLLKDALENDDRAIRDYFCNRVNCDKCLLGKPLRDDGKRNTYVECRKHAKTLVEQFAPKVEEMTTPVTYEQWLDEAKVVVGFAHLYGRTWKRELGSRYQKRLFDICAKWRDTKNYDNPRFKEWLEIFSRMLTKFDVYEDAGKSLLQFTDQYANCIYRDETDDRSLFSGMVADMVKVVEFGLAGISAAEEKAKAEPEPKKERATNAPIDLNNTLNVITWNLDMAKTYANKMVASGSVFTQQPISGEAGAWEWVNLAKNVVIKLDFIGEFIAKTFGRE